MLKKFCEGVGAVASASILGALAVSLWTGKAPWEVAKDIGNKINGIDEESKHNEDALDGDEDCDD